MSHKNCPKRLKNRIFSFLFIIPFLAFTFVFLLSDAIYAQTADEISLQGKIVRNDAGYEGLNVVNGTPSCVTAANPDDCDFQVKYYDAATSGTLEYTEEFTDVEIGDYGGVFNLKLGSVTGSGNYSSLDELLKNESTIYIQIEFAPSGDGSTYSEVFTRTALNASAYSIRSKYAEGSVDDAFKFYSSSSVSSTVEGSVYYDSDENELKLYNGSGWVSVGNAGASAWGTADVGTDYSAYMSSAGIGAFSNFTLDTDDDRLSINADQPQGGLSVYSSYSSSGSWPLVTIKADNSSFDGTLLELIQDGSGNIILADSASTEGVFQVDSIGNLHLANNGIAYLEQFSSLPASGNLSPNSNEGCIYASGGSLYWDDSCDASSPTELGTGSTSLWTDGGTFTYLDSTTDDLVLGASTAASSKFFFDVSEGRLGIGTHTPAASIDIAGASSTISNASGDITIVPESNLLVKGDSADIFITQDDDKYAAGLRSNSGGEGLFNLWRNNSDSDPSDSLIQFSAIFGENSWVNNGNFGVGQTSPGALLHVGDDSAGTESNVLRIEGGGTSGYSQIHFADGVDDNIGRISYSHTDDRMHFYTNDNRALTIDSDGDVGIGTDTPDRLFHIRNSGGDGQMIIQGQQSSSVGNAARLWLSTANSSNIDASNQVGRQAYIEGYATTTWGQNVRLDFATSNSTTSSPTPKMTILPSGYVGIGTTSPDYELDVVGDIYASSEYYLSNGAFAYVASGNTIAGYGDSFFSFRDTSTYFYLDNRWLLQFTSDGIAPYGDSIENLGTNSKRWDNVYADDLILTDDAIIGDDLSVSGKVNLSTDAIEFANTTTGSVPSCNSSTVGRMIYNRDSGDYGMFFYCRQASNGTYSWVLVTATSGTPDIAEYVQVEDLTIEGGDIVSLSTKESQEDSIYDRFLTEKGNKKNADRLLGVISSDPGMVINEEPDPSEKLDYSKVRPLALSGRVPVKVITKELINKGDPITISNVPGYGEVLESTGTIIGKALTDFVPLERFCHPITSVQDIDWQQRGVDSCFLLPDGTYVAKVLVFVNVTWYDPISEDLMKYTEDKQLLTMKANLDTENNIYDIGSTTNRWKDIYSQGSIQIGKDGDSGSIRYDTEENVIQFSNDGSTWISLGSATKKMTLSAEYPGAVLAGDGTNNMGMMTSDAEGTQSKYMNYYEWSSNQQALQDYDVRVRFTLPDDFSSWSDNAIKLNYSTESIDKEMSKVGLYLFEQTSETVDSKKLDQVSQEPAQWGKSIIKSADISQCTQAGDTCVLIIRAYSSNDHFVRVGDIELTYRRDL